MTQWDAGIAGVPRLLALFVDPNLAHILELHGARAIRNGSKCQIKLFDTIHESVLLYYNKEYNLIF